MPLFVRRLLLWCHKTSCLIRTLSVNYHIKLTKIILRFQRISRSVLKNQRLFCWWKTVLKKASIHNYAFPSSCIPIIRTITKLEEGSNCFWKSEAKIIRFTLCNIGNRSLWIEYGYFYLSFLLWKHNDLDNLWEFISPTLNQKQDKVCDLEDYTLATLTIWTFKYHQKVPAKLGWFDIKS